MHIFEETCSEDIKNSIIKRINIEIEESWQELLAEPFLVSNVLPKLDVQLLVMLGHYFLKDTLEKGDFTSLKKNYLVNSQTLTNTLLYNTLLKIHKLFKQKRKHQENFVEKLFNSKLFSNIDEEMFFKVNADITRIVTSFINGIQEHPTSNININVEELLQYLMVLKNLPILYSSQEIQILCVLYLISILFDCHSIVSVISGCETIITG